MSEHGLLIGPGDGSGPVIYKGDDSIITLAKTGSGKSRAVLIPNLLTYPGSNILLDPKGELAQATALWRQSNGITTRIIDPMNEVKDPALQSMKASFNPLDLVIKAHDPFEAAMQIAESLIVPGGKDPFWDRAAQNLFVAYMLWVAFSEHVDDGDRNLSTVWITATHPRNKELLQLMSQSDIPHVQTTATEILETEAETTRDAIRDTFRAHCRRTLGGADVSEAMKSSTVDFGSLRDKPTTVYLVLPFKALRSHAGFLRLMLSSAITQITDKGLEPYGSGRLPVGFWLDEFAALGRMQQLQDGIAQLRGYNVKFWLFLQNLSQLNTTYENGAGAFLGNAGVIQYFGGTADIATQEYISKLMGTKDVEDWTSSQSDRPGEFASRTMSYKQRPVLYPEEVGSINRVYPGQQVIYKTGKGSAMSNIFTPDLRDFPDYLRFMARNKPGRPVYDIG